jgi:hypothetical protein
MQNLKRQEEEDARPVDDRKILGRKMTGGRRCQTRRWYGGKYQPERLQKGAESTSEDIRQKMPDRKRTCGRRSRTGRRQEGEDAKPKETGGIRSNIGRRQEGEDASQKTAGERRFQTERRQEGKGAKAEDGRRKTMPRWQEGEDVKLKDDRRGKMPDRKMTRERICQAGRWQEGEDSEQKDDRREMMPNRKMAGGRSCHPEDGRVGGRRCHIGRRTWRSGCHIGRRQEENGCRTKKRQEREDIRSKDSLREEIPNPTGGKRCQGERWQEGEDARHAYLST